jgi:hypothetical protein
MWCPVPLPEDELQRRKLRSDKYKPLAARLLEFYESDSSVEADEDTSDEVEDDVGTDPNVGGAMKPRHRTRSAVGKQSASSPAAAVSAVKAEENKKKRKTKAASPPMVVTLLIPTPARGRSSQKMRRKTRPLKSCQSPRIDRRGGRKVLLPRGSGS